MITAQFQKSGQKFKAFSIEGHAGYADAGRDIVCASVTSAVQLTANAITEQFGEKAEVADVYKRQPLECKRECSLTG